MANLPKRQFPAKVYNDKLKEVFISKFHLSTLLLSGDKEHAKKKDWASVSWFGQAKANMCKMKMTMKRRVTTMQTAHVMKANIMMTKMKLKKVMRKKRALSKGSLKKKKLIKATEMF